MADGQVIGVRNFGDENNSTGLVELRQRPWSSPQKDPDNALLCKGLTSAEHEALLRVRKSSAPGAIKKALSFASLTGLEAQEETAEHWTRWLFGSRISSNAPLLLHGFDIALVAELEKVEHKFAKQLQELTKRWHHHKQDDIQHLIGEAVDRSSGSIGSTTTYPKKKISSNSSKFTGSGEGQNDSKKGLVSSTSESGGTIKSLRRKFSSSSRRGRGNLNKNTPLRTSLSSNDLIHYAAVAATEEHDFEDPKKAERPIFRLDAAEKKSLKRALAELDQDCRDLIDFASWNYTAFVKITKKRDKIFPNEPSIKALFCERVRCDCDFWEAKKAWALQDEIRDSFAKAFCDGELPEADLRIRDLQFGMTQSTFGLDPHAVRFGYRAGVAAVLCVWVLWDCIEVVDARSETHASVASKPAWPVFRAAGALVAWHWMWGLSLHVWASYRVNVDFLFDTVYEDTSSGATASNVYDEAALETIALLASLLVYYKATYHGGLPLFVSNVIDPSDLAAFIPIGVVCTVFVRLVSPWNRRKHLWRSLGKILVAPVSQVRFVDTYIADVLSSMVKVFLDTLWTACYVGTGDVFRAQVSTTNYLNKKDDTPKEEADEALMDPEMTRCTTGLAYRNIAVPLACLLPLWFRFAQCLRKYNDVGQRIHILNAAKYALSLFVALSSALELVQHRHTWLALFCISSAYSWLWDVVMDWGLRFRWHKPKDADLIEIHAEHFGHTDKMRFIFERPKYRTMYPRHWWYSLAVAADIVGRFVWLATLIPPTGFGKRLNSVIPDYLVPILALVELARRCVWGFFSP
uniref:EXS domain-containing protein n=1 Tax=Aureoumbra lagunensis TaxID=44058 RepID=A0A7S3NGY9_9STRA